MSAVERMSELPADEQRAADELQRGCGYSVKAAKSTGDGDGFILMTETGRKHFETKKAAVAWAEEQRLAGWNRAAGKGL